MDAERLKNQMIEAMLPHAAFDGWSAESLKQAARDLDLDPTMPARLFPGGAVEAAAWFSRLADRRMAEALAAEDLPPKIGPKVFRAVQLRLAPWDEHREAVRRAASLLAMPANLGLAGRLAWDTADAIWLAVGDQSHDFSWYTKRASLTAVFAATALCWLEDSSEGSTETWAFLRRRLDEIRQIPQWRQKLESMLPGKGKSLGRWAEGIQRKAG